MAWSIFITTRTSRTPIPAKLLSPTQAEMNAGPRQIRKIATGVMISSETRVTCK